MSTRTLGMLACALVVAFGTTQSAKAQGGRGGMGMMGGGMGPMAGFRALTTPEGEKELNITADQKAKLAELNENMRSNMMEKFQSAGAQFQDASPEERREMMASIQKEIAESTMKDLKEILNADQLKRYNEINLQAQGVGAFMSPEVQKQLGFTDEQKSKVKAAQDDLQAAMQDAMQMMQDDREGARAAMTKAQDTAREKVMGVLTDAQKETWKQMTGKPFTMPTFQPGQGGPGRRRAE